MSHDFRPGSPKPHATATNHQAGGVPGLVWAPRINYSGTDVTDPGDTGIPGPTFHPLRVPGLGDVRLVPPAICALLYGRTFDFDVTFSAVGITQNWTGTLSRGEQTEIDDGGTTVTGTALTTILSTWSLRGSPLKPAEGRSRYWSNLGPGDDQEEFDLILGDTDYWPLWYFAALDEWVVYNGLIDLTVRLYSDAEADSGSAGSRFHGGDPDVEGLTFCGVPWTLGGDNVTSLSGEITVATWLDP